ncbi:Transposable element Tc1 transposase [Labeo rohita]|uniref:Transposable element Tc1 transposase n=1 Tax=Labeo rohita TaxID=84645 RepID=A0ABQ8LZH8_LABRO|nr:Transposable element Tc1 transposase [Labeo rohita]
MGKTADLAMDQKTITDTLHKENKSQKAEVHKQQGRILSSKTDSNTWESLTRSRMKLELAHQESPCSDVFRKRATKPLLKQKRLKHLTWAKEKKNWTVAQVWRKSEEAQNPSCLKSSVKFLKSVMIWGAVTSAGVGPLCFIKCKVNAAIYQEILEQFMLPSADKLYGDADFLFQQDFSTCPQCQNHFQVVC